MRIDEITTKIGELATRLWRWIAGLGVLILLGGGAAVRNAVIHNEDTLRTVAVDVGRDSADLDPADLRGIGINLGLSSGELKDAADGISSSKVTDAIDKVTDKLGDPDVAQDVISKACQLANVGPPVKENLAIPAGQDFNVGIVRYQLQQAQNSDYQEQFAAYATCQASDIIDNLDF